MPPAPSCCGEVMDERLNARQPGANSARWLVIGGLVVLVAAVWGFVLLLLVQTRPAVRLPTATPSPPAVARQAILNVIQLDADTFVVTGEGWSPYAPVELYLLAPDQPDYWLGTVYANGVGAFQVEFVFQPGQPTGAQVWLEARAGSQTVRVPFVFVAPPPTATPLPTATATPSPVPTPTPTPPPAGAAGPVCRVTIGSANGRRAPAPDAEVLFTLPRGAEVDPLVRDVTGTWIQVYTEDGRTGWVSVDALACTVSVLDLPIVEPTPTPTPSPTPTPTPTPVFLNWRGEYFDNAGLVGDPVLVRDDETILFDWGEGQPAPNLPADNFSVRWTRAWRFSAGTYRFVVRVDDGARLYVNGRLVLEDWRVAAERALTADVTLTEGEHTLQLEYFEAGGRASVVLWWEPKPDAFAGWRGEYFDTPEPGDRPLLVRDDAAIDFDWALGSPAPVIPPNNFSARWTREVFFDAGLYRFTVVADDGVRLWLDGSLILDRWTVAKATYTVDVNVARGPHTLRLEYFEATGDAEVSLRWDRVDQTFRHWKGEYFDNPNLAGPPVLLRDDPVVDFNWGMGSPHPAIPPDNFSARWTGRPTFEPGVYRFTVTADDGVRLYVNGALVLDRWGPGVGQYSVEVAVPGGPTDVQLDYFEWVGGARVRLEWERLPPTPTLTATPTPSPTPTPTNTPTTTPTPTATAPPTPTPTPAPITTPIGSKPIPIPTPRPPPWWRQWIW